MKKKNFGIILLIVLMLSACNLPTSSADTTAPILQNLAASTDSVFFSDSSCGPTRVTISVDASDNSGALSSVGMQYRYRAENTGASPAWTTVSLPAAGGGHFAGELDVAAQAESSLGQGSGTLEYQVYAIDLAGNTVTSPEQYARSISVQHCDGGVASNPSTPNETPAAPPAPATPTVAPANNGGAAPGNNGNSSNSGNNGSSGNNNGGSSQGNNNSGNNANPTLPPAANLPFINNFAGPATVSTGELYLLEWDVQDACKVFLDGTEVGASETMLFTAPLSDTTYTYTLAAWGSPCDASTEMTAQVTVSITSGAVFNPGGGNGNSGNNGNNGGNNGGTTAITIYNNSSHTIVEFLLDGDELIGSEADSILPGASAPLDGLNPGQGYSYQVGAGFWSGGQKYSIYPLPGGSFQPEDGSITIYDPSIEQIMTQYGNSAQYTGMFWDGTTPGCASFVFYSNGSFEFYVDGAYNDSGWYSLVSRNPSAYSVDINIQAASDSVQGNYSYSGAAAGLLYVNNGPSGWEQIEYVYNGSCP